MSFNVVLCGVASSAVLCCAALLLLLSCACVCVLGVCVCACACACVCVCVRVCVRVCVCVSPIDTASKPSRTVATSKVDQDQRNHCSLLCCAWTDS